MSRGTTRRKSPSPGRPTSALLDPSLEGEQRSIDGTVQLLGRPPLGMHLDGDRGHLTLTVDLEPAVIAGALGAPLDPVTMALVDAEPRLLHGRLPVDVDRRANGVTARR